PSASELPAEAPKAPLSTAVARPTLSSDPAPEASAAPAPGDDDFLSRIEATLAKSKAAPPAGAASDPAPAAAEAPAVATVPSDPAPVFATEPLASDPLVGEDPG